MTAGRNDLNVAGPVGTSTREERLAALEVEAARVRSCGPCNRAIDRGETEHPGCVLIGCRCTRTEACRRNTLLTIEREGPLP